MNLNLVVIEGHLASDVTNEGEYSFFTIDVRNKENKTINVRVTNQLAENCIRYLKTGSHVLVSGHLEGTHINGREVKFLPAK